MKPLVIRYRNWRGEVSTRTITPITVWWGKSEYHEGEQWFLRAYDHDRNAKRDFAMKDFNV